MNSLKHHMDDSEIFMSKFRLSKKDSIKFDKSFQLWCSWIYPGETMTCHLSILTRAKSELANMRQSLMIMVVFSAAISSSRTDIVTQFDRLVN